MSHDHKDLIARLRTDSGQTPQEAADILEALESLRDDALRYRFIRDSNDPTWRPFNLRWGTTEQADKMVDEAMKRAAT